MRFRLGLAALMVAVLGTAARGADEPGFTVALISREIRPYLLAVESLEKALGRPVFRVYLEDGSARVHAVLRRPERPPQAVVAVGPEAADFVASMEAMPPLLALMVVSAPSWPKDSPPPSAVILQIPLEDQLGRLKAVFPDLDAVVVPSESEKASADFGRVLAGVRAASGLRVLPLALEDPPVWSRFLERASEMGARAVVFLPHASLTSTAVIRHVVAETILRRMLPIGYNRAFLEAGAGAAFLFDPEETGRLAADMLRSERFGKEPVVQGAPYRMLVKGATVRHLGWSLPEPLPSGVDLE